MDSLGYNIGDNISKKFGYDQFNISCIVGNNIGSGNNINSILGNKGKIIIDIYFDIKPSIK